MRCFAIFAGMQNVLFLLIKYGYHVLFILLEIICFYLIVSYNKDQKDIFINSTNVFVTSINNRMDKLENYLALEEINDSLMLENSALLRRLIRNNVKPKITSDSLVIDSAYFELIPSSICNSTFHLKNNSITLCDGANSGIKADMGVISKNGLVGIVRKVSPHRSLVLSILHSQSNVSCAIKTVNAHGSLVWNGSDPLKMSLLEIPKHTNVTEGDTVITSGFSTIFPKGIPVGLVEAVKTRSGSYSYDITVQLFNDPTTLNYVFVVDNKLASEQKALEATDI